MKKVLLACLIFTIILVIVACTTPHTHTAMSELIVVKEATCVEEGISHILCAECGEILNTISIPKTNEHSESVIPAVESTCKEAGLSEGKECSLCGKVLIAQQETPLKAHQYDDKYDETCNVCGNVRDAECPHKEIEILEDKSPTCTEIGYTEGEKCKKCGEILTAQEIINAKGHSFCDWVIVTEPSVSKEGLKEKVCFCGEKETEVISKLVPSKGLKFTLNDDQQSYSVGNGSCTDDVIIIPDTYEGLPVTAIAEAGFYYCKHITRVVIPDSIQYIDFIPFTYCELLENIAVDKNNKHYQSIDGNLYTKDGKTLILYAPGKTEVSFVVPDFVSEISIAAFAWNYSLKKVVIHDSVTNIDNNALGLSYALADIEVDVNNEYYKSIDGNFYSKDGKTLIQYAIGKADTVFNVPNFVTHIDERAFQGCTSLTSVVVGDSVISIGEYAFGWCESLTSITFEGTVAQWNAIEKMDNWSEYVGEYIIYCTDGQMAKDGTVTYYCSEGLEFTLNDDSESYSVTGVGTCIDTDIIIPNTYNDLPITSIGDKAFLDCTYMVSIIIPDTVKTIGQMAFRGCTSLESIVIPNGVREISDYTFTSCVLLTEISIPSTVRTIGVCAFSSCKSLVIINFSGANVLWKDYVEKAVDWAPPTACIIYCNDGKIDKYDQYLK